MKYAVEPWRGLRDEMIPMLVRHWREVALHHDDVPLDIDERRYNEMDDAGNLHIVTARDAGRLVAYHVSVIGGHLHYRGTLHGITDVYFVDRAYRDGWALLRLLREVERTLRRRGVRKIISATKLHIPMGLVFERAGYEPIETVYAKILR